MSKRNITTQVTCRGDIGSVYVRDCTEIGTRDILLCEMLMEFDQRLTALERGETKDYSLTHTCKDGDTHTVSIENCPICRPKPAPTPTVERFRVFRFAGSFDLDEVYKYKKESIGEVVANRYVDGDLWYVQFDNKKDAVVMADDTYRALVEYNTKSGVWERT